MNTTTLHNIRKAPYDILLTFPIFFFSCYFKFNSKLQELFWIKQSYYQSFRIDWFDIIQVDNFLCSFSGGTIDFNFQLDNFLIPWLSHLAFDSSPQNFDSHILRLNIIQKLSILNFKNQFWIARTTLVHHQHLKYIQVYPSTT